MGTDDVAIIPETDDAATKPSLFPWIRNPVGGINDLTETDSREEMVSRVVQGSMPLSNKIKDRSSLGEEKISLTSFDNTQPFVDNEPTGVFAPGFLCEIETSSKDVGETPFIESGSGSSAIGDSEIIDILSPIE